MKYWLFHLGSVEFIVKLHPDLLATCQASLEMITDLSLGPYIYILREREREREREERERD